ncbi:hypothetical protein GCM10010240_67140 [Streptomyces griseoviridis]|nr:hypothetical protein GCM10010240_67140 [Streptomyces griseoviridis]
MPSAGMIPPPNTTMSSAPSAEHHDVLGALLPEQPQHLGEERHAGPGEHREADAVGVLLERGGDDLAGCPVRAGADDLRPRLAQGTRDDLGSAR